MYAARGLIGPGIKGPHDIDEVVKLVEERGIDIAGERVALVVGLVDDKVRVANTRQVRMEQRLGELARAAALDKTGALSPAAIQAADCTPRESGSPESRGRISSPRPTRSEPAAG